MNKSSEQQHYTAPIIYCACLSRHRVAASLFALITLHRTSKDDWSKHQVKEVSNVLIFLVQTPFKFQTCMDFFADSCCVLEIIFWKLTKKNAVGTGAPFQRGEVSGNKAITSYTQCKQKLAYKTGQPHPTTAKQIVPKIFLDSHLPKCRWVTPIMGISTLCQWKGTQNTT